MAVIIKWSDEATKTFDNNIGYLEKEWTDKEIANFVKQTDLKLLNIEYNPKIYKRSEKKSSIRKANINKNITLFYNYSPRKKEVTLLTFWHNRQDPKKIKILVFHDHLKYSIQLCNNPDLSGQSNNLPTGRQVQQ